VPVTGWPRPGGGCRAAGRRVAGARAVRWPRRRARSSICRRCGAGKIPPPVSEPAVFENRRRKRRPDMRAMVYRGPYKVRVEEKDMPRIEHPNDAIVRVERAAICGSDLHLYHGLMPDTRVGTTFGHEFVGVVEQVGGSVRNLRPGDRVMVPFNIY